GADGAAELCATVAAADGQGQSFVLVLDDAHMAEPALLGANIRQALGELPAGSTIALASRAEPMLPLGRLRADRALSEVRLHQLAMPPPQAQLLLAREGIELGAAEIDALVRHTEGWPAALYLAGLAVQEDTGRGVDVAGGHHLIAEYLREEILVALPS